LEDTTGMTREWSITHLLRRSTGMTRQRWSGEQGQKNDSSKALLMDNNQLPRNYDSATQARRMSQLRQQQVVRASSSSRRTSSGRGSLLSQQQPSVLRMVLDNDGSGKKKKISERVPKNQNRAVPPRKEQPPPQQQMHQQHQPHSFLYSMLNPLSHRRQANLFKRFIATVILLDLLCFIVSTDPTIGVNSDHGRLFPVCTIMLLRNIFLR
jgi:hypothetical protein